VANRASRRTSVGRYVPGSLTWIQFLMLRALLLVARASVTIDLSCTPLEIVFLVTVRMSQAKLTWRRNTMTKSGLLLSP
jgi:hypothetical protein